jgi:anti-sigma factor RsiW
MNCQTAQADLVTLIYGDLEAIAASALESHLAHCSACDARRHQLVELLAAVTPAAVFPREGEVDWNLPLTCRAVRAELATFLRGGSDHQDDDALLEHMGRCSACTDEAAAIDATLDAVRNAFPREGEVDWDSFALETAQLARAASHGDSRTGGPRGKLVAGPWARQMRRALPFAALVMAALGLGYMAARLTPPATETPAPVLNAGAPPAPAPVDTPTSMTDKLLDRTRLELARADTARYLEESHAVLASFTGLPVPCEGNNIDTSMESEVSSRLLRRKQLLDRDLDDVEIARARRLADEVGSLLEEIAILSKCASPAQVEEIRQIMAHRQLMMRIKILADELEQRDQGPRVPGGKGGDRA